MARALHPDWFDQFDYRQAERSVPLENGCVVLHSPTGRPDIAIPLPSSSDTADVYLFDDGEINEVALLPAGVYQGTYRIGAIEVSGQFSIGVDGKNLAIIRWIYGADGFRITEKSKYRIS